MKHLLKATFAILQQIGKALMLPVSVLPIAGILLGIGSAHFSFLPEAVSNVMLGAGDSIFANLPLLFAVSVTLGLTNNDGVAGFSSIVSYAVLLATMGVVAKILGVPTKATMGIETINVGVAGGIFMGAITAYLYNRFHSIELPPYLGFFGGKRFIPIASSFAAISFGVALSFVWPPIGNAIQAFSVWASHENPALAFTLYGVGERSLIPFGLHHILNAPFFFETGSYVDPATGKVITGEIQRYLYGDPTAGNLAGGYLFKMWGLPGAALAMWYMAKDENKKRVGGIMIAAALTSFITGITEPIEFSFIFLAPLLYLAHALIAGFSFLLCILLEIKHGTTFSHGLIDFIILYPQSSKAWYLWILGPIWAAMYFSVFCFIIKKFNLKTPGRETDAVSLSNINSKESATSSDSFSEQLALALGGVANIKSLDSCITRLRVQLHSTADIDPAKFKQLGATNSVIVGNGVQVIFGPRSENIKAALDRYIQNPSRWESKHEIKTETAGLETKDATKKAEAAQTHHIKIESTLTTHKSVNIKDSQWLLFLGGQENLLSAELISDTRLRLHLQSLSKAQVETFKEELLKQGLMLQTLNNHVLHIVSGANQKTLRQKL